MNRNTCVLCGRPIVYRRCDVPMIFELRQLGEDRDGAEYAHKSCGQRWWRMKAKGEIVGRGGFKKLDMV